MNSMEKRLRDPKIFGPGLWDCIHTAAREAVDTESKLEFLRLMNRTRDNLKCMDCRKHCTEYMLAVPIQNYFFYGEDEGAQGCFIWAWEFHNVVNSRLGKGVITLAEALALFNPDTVCLEEDCGSEGVSSVKIVSR